MRKADLEAFRQHLLKSAGKDPEALIAAVLHEHEARVDAENKITEMELQHNKMFLDHQAVTKERDDLKQENKTLRKTVSDLTAQLNERKRDCFGRSTEASDSLGWLEDNEDPLSEDTPADAEIPSSDPPPHPPRDFDDAAKKLSGNCNKDCDNGKTGDDDNKGTGGSKKPRCRGLSKEALARLPQRNIFGYSIELLDALYGEGNWKVIGFREGRSIEYIPSVRYLRILYHPVVKLSDGRIITPEIQKFYPHSLLSESLLASVFDQKFNLCLPVYRMLHNAGLEDLGLTDTTIYNWINVNAREYLKPVYDHLVCRMMAIPYHQCDETFWMVIRDGRKPGSKSFMWVHVTSELYDGPQIVIVEYEKTRGADHLREFYRIFKGNIGCDAFSAYPVLEKEYPGMITISGCMMHVRRRFFFALLLKWTAINSEDVAITCLEAEVFVMIQDIYHAETPLKELTADERLKRRQIEVRPLIEKFYNRLREIVLTDPSLSDKMRDAVSYALNHECEVCRFLDDANIAIDNGHCERAIKPLALLRRNSLFSTSVKGAEATAISISLVRTAKANGAIPYFYLKYIFEEVPKHRNDKNMDWLTDCEPWSTKYKAYEEAERLKLPDFTFANLPDTPWAVWKQLMKVRDCA